MYKSCKSRGLFAITLHAHLQPYNGSTNWMLSTTHRTLCYAFALRCEAARRPTALKDQAPTTSNSFPNSPVLSFGTWESRRTSLYLFNKQNSSYMGCQSALRATFPPCNSRKKLAQSCKPPPRSSLPPENLPPPLQKSKASAGCSEPPPAKWSREHSQKGDSCCGKLQLTDTKCYMPVIKRSL